MGRLSGSSPPRPSPQGGGGSGAVLGWLAALLLHAAVLAALLLGLPKPHPPPGSRPAVSLVFQAAVAPRPVGEPAVRPLAAARLIGNAAAKPVLTAKPKFAASPAPGLARPPVQAAGFVAATPLGGNVNPPPNYPATAIAYGEQGSVLLSIHVLPDGRTDFVSVTQSSGYRVLDQAAVDAVMQWRFAPARLAGKPVVMEIAYWIHFDLSTQGVAAGP